MPDIRSQPAYMILPQLHVGAQPKPTGMRWSDHEQVWIVRKPKGGLWTSTFIDDDRGSDWVRWCRREDFGGVDGSDWWVVQPIGTDPVIILDTWDDFDAVEAVYGIPAYPNIPTLDMTAWDFDRMLSDGFVGVHLTERGSMDMHYGRPGRDLNAWDCESTVWFRWCFDVAVPVIQRQPA